MILYLLWTINVPLIVRSPLHCELHWLDVPQRIQFKLRVTVHRCLQGNAPQYPVNCYKSTTGVAGWWSGIVVSALASINEVNLRRTRG